MVLHGFFARQVKVQDKDKSMAICSVNILKAICLQFFFICIMRERLCLLNILLKRGKCQESH